MDTPDEDPLLRLAKAVADGTPIDWARELAVPPGLRAQLEQLRALEAMAALSRDPAADPMLGRQLSHYRIDASLGAGGMGVVYRAEDQRLHRPVALKVLPPELITSEEHRRRLLREARAGAAVVHPSVAAVHEVGEDHGTVFVAMELVEGETLQQRIAGRSLALPVVLQIATEVADGLAAAHRARVIHRDLKPANVVIRPDGHVKILDFGLARLGGEAGGGSAPGRLETLPPEPTREGRLLGTPAYMSPEQVRGEPLDVRSDLFSFGSTLYEMLTGQAPFRRASAAESLTAVLRDEPIPPSRAHPELPRELDAIVARCLRKDPQQRYADAGALAADLRGLGGAVPATGSGPPRPAKTRRLAAILFSDIVGYTALMETDEARAIAARDRHRALLRPIVERFRGELIEAPGDEALAVFASSLRAVDAAIALQEALRDADDLQLRIGIHVGDVLFRDGEVVGEGVNVAARIRALAAPGGICVSGPVYEQVKNQPHLGARSLGSRALKNVARPVEVFALSSRDVRPPRRRRRWAWVGLAAAVALLLAAGLLWQRSPGPPPAPAVHALAVLPFANLSADPEQAYFADGIAEELLNTVARFDGLRVIGRTSSFSFRNSDADLKTIGQKLGADVILEGSVRTAGKRVRITAQLVDAADGVHRWSESYDRELGDIFAIQTEIATQIAAALRVALSPQQHGRLAAAPTRNFQAYQAFLLGRQRLTKFTTASVAEGIRHLEQAIALDPNFALAHAYLAIGCLELFENSDLPPGEMLARAQAAAEKALALDDQLAEPRVALGAIEYFRNDFEGAEAAFQRALALNPSSVGADLWYGDLLGQRLGRYEEALGLRRKAVELDPLSLETVPRLGVSLEWVGRFDESLSWYERSLEIDPDFAWGHELIGDHHWFVSGRLDEALVWYLRAVALNHEATTSAFVGQVLLELGDPVQGGRWLQRAVDEAPANFHTNRGMGDFEVRRGDEAAALEHLRKAFAIWPSEVLTRLRDLEVRAGRDAEALALYEDLYPELLHERDPQLDFRNYLAAIDLAPILSRSGERVRADRLLERSLERIRERPRLGGQGYGIADVQVYALRGEKQRALSALRQAIDAGWHRDWWYQLEHKPDLAPLHGDPEYQAMVEEIRADMTAQLEHVREMEARGELALAAGPTAPDDRRSE